MPRGQVTRKIAEETNLVIVPAPASFVVEVILEEETFFSDNEVFRARVVEHVLCEQPQSAARMTKLLLAVEPRSVFEKREWDVGKFLESLRVPRAVPKSTIPLGGYCGRPPIIVPRVLTTE